MYEFAGSKSAKLVATESGNLVARFLQSIVCLTRVQIYNKLSHVALRFAVFHISIYLLTARRPRVLLHFFTGMTIFIIKKHNSTQRIVNLMTIILLRMQA